MKSLLAVLLLCLSYNSLAIEEVSIVLKDHLFVPNTVVVPEQSKVKLLIHNQDDSPEELDSFDLNREKVIFAHAIARIFIGPLEPGVYEFFGEYHPNSAQGKVIVVSKGEYQKHLQQHANINTKEHGRVH